jgi:CelD/BcsL family acetyltransferase involved in cellulose biosynthesis
MDSVAVGSFLWKFLNRKNTFQDSYLLYAPDGIRSNHSLMLPKSFHEYLSKFKSKTRNTFKRKVNRLREYGNGSLSMHRVDATDQIETFLEGAVAVAQNSWQQKRLGTRIDCSPQTQSKLTNLAMEGLLRSYLLICGNKPCAFLLGYQFRDIYYYVEVAYDRSFSQYSPGTVLLYLLIEDLINYHPPQWVNFGIGHASYKKEFGNVHSEDASILLFRNNLTNKVLRSTHSLFRSCVRSIRKRIKENDE